jgi:hypothetical protein
MSNLVESVASGEVRSNDRTHVSEMAQAAKVLPVWLAPPEPHESQWLNKVLTVLSKLAVDRGLANPQPRFWLNYMNPVTAWNRLLGFEETTLSQLLARRTVLDGPPRNLS